MNLSVTIRGPITVSWHEHGGKAVIALDLDEEGITEMHLEPDDARILVEALTDVLDRLKYHEAGGEEAEKKKSDPRYWRIEGMERFKKNPMLDEHWYELRAFDEDGVLQATLGLNTLEAVQSQMEGDFRKENMGAGQIVLMKTERLGSWRN